MTTREYHKQKRKTEIAKSYQEWFNRLRIDSWNQPEEDWAVRLSALIQFHPAHSTRQILNRAVIR